MIDIVWITLGVLVITFLIYINRNKSTKAIKTTVKKVCMEYSDVKFLKCETDFLSDQKFINLELYFVEDNKIITDEEKYQELQKNIKDTVETTFDIEVKEVSIIIKKLKQEA